MGFCRQKSSNHHGNYKGTHPPQEIAGLLKTHWFPLIRPAIRAGYLFLGGFTWGPLGGSGPLGSHERPGHQASNILPEEMAETPKKKRRVSSSYLQNHLPINFPNMLVVFDFFWGQGPLKKSIINFQVPKWSKFQNLTNKQYKGTSNPPHFTASKGTQQDQPPIFRHHKVTNWIILWHEHIPPP